MAFANDLDAFDVQGVDQKRHLVLFAFPVEDFDGEVAGLVAADPRGKEPIRLRRVHPIGEWAVLAEHSEAGCCQGFVCARDHSLDHRRADERPP